MERLFYSFSVFIFDFLFQTCYYSVVFLIFLNLFYMNSLKKIGLSLFVTTLAIQETFADGCAIFGCAKADPLNTGGS